MTKNYFFPDLKKKTQNTEIIFKSAKQQPICWGSYRLQRGLCHISIGWRKKRDEEM